MDPVRGIYPLFGELITKLTMSNNFNRSFGRGTRRTRQQPIKRRSKSFKNRLIRPNIPIELKALTSTYNHFILPELANVTYTDGNLSTGWTCLSLIPQGSSANSRNGSQVIITSINVKMILFAPTGNPDTVRIMLIRDLGLHGVAPPLNEIFDNTANNLTCIGPDCRRQYRLLKDIMVDIGGQNELKTININYNARVRTYYFGQTATLASMENNAIYIFAITVNGNTTSQVLKYAQVVNFIDI
jgi:hypothetical protein